MKTFLSTYALFILVNTLFLLNEATHCYGQTPQAYFPETDDNVTLLKKYGDTLFVGGAFNNIDSLPRNFLCAVDISTGNVLPWNPNPNGEPDFMEISNNRLIIGGSFTNISGTSVKNIAIYSLPSLQIVSLATVQDESVSSGISIYSNYLYYMGLAPHVPFQYISRYDLNLLEPDTLFRIPADGTSFGSINSMLADNDYVYVAGDLNDPGGDK